MEGGPGRIEIRRSSMGLPNATLRMHFIKPMLAVDFQGEISHSMYYIDKNNDNALPSRRAESRKPLKRLMPPARFERTTPGLGIRCSILLSYEGKSIKLMAYVAFPCCDRGDCDQTCAQVG